MTDQTIRIPITGNPSHWFGFTPDADGNGYHAEISVRSDDRECLHALSIRQGQPLGKIWWMLDGIEAGTWATAEIPGFGIDEKGLYCAALWAIQAINHRHAVSPCDCD